MRRIGIALGGGAMALRFAAGAAERRESGALAAVAPGPKDEAPARARCLAAPG